MIFENPQIETGQLPSVNDIEYKKLAPAYKQVEYIATAIFFAFLLIGAVIAFYNVPPEHEDARSGIFIIWAVLFALSMYLAGKRYEMSGYALREHDVIHKYGVWWRTVTVIPFNRMQHCEISQGPVQNIFGLATLRVFTAGGNSSDMAIDGLEHEEAKRIKDFITEKIGSQSAVFSRQSSV
ncbi:MAG TPA: hypothetical protein ENJ95_23650 [Bacteroidetes bacterium]|nr:hypothetical protein [Bacteroidota bacterium]